MGDAWGGRPGAVRRVGGALLRRVDRRPRREVDAVCLAAHEHPIDLVADHRDGDLLAARVVNGRRLGLVLDVVVMRERARRARAARRCSCALVWPVESGACTNAP